MRDPARIPRLLAKLQLVWESAPDLRLGQLISNISYVTTKRRDGQFNLEDDQIEKALDESIAYPTPYHKGTKS